MFKPEKDILIHKKSESIAKKVIKKLWENRQEFSPMLEQIVLETFKESLEIISATHTEKAQDIFADPSTLSEYQSYQIGLKFGEIVGRGQSKAVNVLEEYDSQQRVFKQTRFLFAVR